MSKCVTHYFQRRTKESAGRPAVILVIAASLIACGSTASARSSTAEVASDIEGIVVPTAQEGPLHAAARRAGAQLAQSPAPIQQAQAKVDRAASSNHGYNDRGRCRRGPFPYQTAGGYNHDPRVALVGAGAGAWGGLVAGAIHKARAQEKVGVGTKIGIAVGAVGMVVLPLLACYGAGGCGGVS